MSLEKAEQSDLFATVDPVEGVDYIVDYYAVLGLERGSDEERIRRALRDKRTQYHPDRLIQAGDKIQAVANREMALFAKAEQILLNPEVKPFYDERLNGFEPRLVSNDGRAILDLNKRRLLPDYLLHGQEINFSPKIEHAKQLSGFDEAHFEQVETLYKSDPNNPIFRNLYKDVLGKKLLFLGLLEEMVWAQAGVMNVTDSIRGLLCHVDEYAEAVQSEIERVSAEEIPQALQLRSQALLAGVASPLLLTDGSAENQEGDESTATEISTEVRNRITSTFLGRADRIKEVAAQKQEVLEELVKLTDYEYLIQNTPPTTSCNLFLAHEGKVMCGFRSSNETLTMIEEEAIRGMPLGDLKEKDFRDDTIVITHNPEIKDLLIQISWVAEKHFTDVMSKDKEAGQE